MSLTVDRQAEVQGTLVSWVDSETRRPAHSSSGLRSTDPTPLVTPHARHRDYRKSLCRASLSIIHTAATGTWLRWNQAAPLLCPKSFQRPLQGLHKPLCSADPPPPHLCTLGHTSAPTPGPLHLLLFWARTLPSPQGVLSRLLQRMLTCPLGRSVSSDHEPKHRGLNNTAVGPWPRRVCRILTVYAVVHADRPARR